MASPEKVAELAARLRSLADSISTHEDPGERSKTSLQEAAVELEQTVTKFHSRGDAHVLVLIDAHSHPFCNDVYHESSEHIYSEFERVKPFKIRSRLHKAIKNYLIGISAVAALGASRLVVRLYADSAKLENDLLRPLQQFAVQFSSIDADFDFIGVQDEATVELKVSNAFETARYDTNCKHIFLAAWRRPVYLAMLRTSSKKVTLIEGNGMGAGAVFVPLPCDSISISKIFEKPAGKDPLASLTSHSMRKRFIEKLISVEVPCKDESHGLSYLDTHYICDIEPIVSNDTTDAHRQKARLPYRQDAKRGHVPVNETGHRLEYHMELPSPADRQAYAEKFGSGAPPCRMFHLGKGKCRFGSNCSFDHSEISRQICKVVRYMTKRNPCAMGSDCHRADCMYGHVCQDAKCLSDELDSCSMRKFHGVSFGPVMWVPDDFAPRIPAGGATGVLAEEGEGATVESSWY